MSAGDSLSQQQFNSEGSAQAPLFHVAPRSARDSITEHGLDHTKGTSPWASYSVEFRNFPRGNYLFADPSDAAQYVHPHGEQDIWQVDRTGLDLQPDPLMERHRPGAAYLTTSPIPPERLTKSPTRPSTSAS